MPEWIAHPGLALLAAHVLVDFVVQTDHDVRDKSRLHPMAFARHGLQHAFMAWILVGVPTTWTIPLAVLVVHVAIDIGKETTRRLLRTRRTLGDAADLRLFTLDQIAHAVSLVAIALWLGNAATTSFWAQSLGTSLWTTVLVFTIGIVLAVRTGAIVVALTVRRFHSDLDVDAPEDTLGTEPRGLSGGGAMIGALERALVFFFVLTGMPQGVGFLLAAKSILRFGDLNARQQRVETEYVIIGTLASFAWSLLVAWCTREALRMLG